MFGGSETFSLAVGATITSDVSSTLAAAGYHLDTATLTGTITNSRNNSSISGSDTADYTGETYSATLQKQIDVNGTGKSTSPALGRPCWPTPPSTSASSPPTPARSSSAMPRCPTAARAPIDFTFGGGSLTTVLAVGGSVTSDVATVIASTGYQADTATLNGSVSNSYGDTGAVSATSGANFTGTTPSITIDKQISVNGGAWTDIGSDMTDPWCWRAPRSPSKSSW